MLDVALKFRRVFERMYEECLLFMRYFDEKDGKGKIGTRHSLAYDWDKANAFIHFLKNFYDVTLEFKCIKNSYI